jgi:hypothetical protein
MHREQNFLSRSWKAYLSLIEESPRLAGGITCQEQTNGSASWRLFQGRRAGLRHRSKHHNAGFVNEQVRVFEAGQNTGGLLLVAGRGASVCQAINSCRARLYTRRVIGDEALSSTSAFNLRHSVALSATTSSFIC